MFRHDIRNTIALGLLIISVVLLIPGLFNDIFTLDVSVSIPFLGKEELHHETRSILGTIGVLFENGNPLVAVLILLFSVVVPFLKAGILLAMLLFPYLRRGGRLIRFVAVISKWSMADVFVVGIFIAFLSTNTDDNVEAFLHSGFYFFTAYCIVSIIAVQLIRLESLPRPAARTAETGGHHPPLP